MHYITDTLYWISTGLLVPVVVLLIWFFLRALVFLGGWFGHYMDTRRLQAALAEPLAGLKGHTQLPDLEARLGTLKSRQPMATALRSILEANNLPLVEKALADFELEAQRDMALGKTLSKMGPMLGLMGTLIPMGPALVGLSTGDIASMAYNMQVAFATTVVGLFSAAVGFVVLQAKQRWYRRDLGALEFVAQLQEQKLQAL